MNPTVTLLASCPDRKGLIAGMSDFIYRRGGNLLHTDQHTDLEAGVFLTRMEWELDGFGLPRTEIAGAFQPLAREFKMQFEIFFSDQSAKVAIFVSRQLHCLHDLLLRHRAGEFQAEIALVVGNHPEAADIAGWYGVDFLHLPVTPENKLQQEAAAMRALRERGVEVVILARYMQVLSESFVAAWPNRIINIHHSFLPAFLGAQPYRRAHERGVKLIGATSHYVTAELDNGPIIEQKVIRVSHRDSVADLIRKGRDLEKVVLARAVRLHLSHRLLTYGNRTVVFD